MPERADLTKPKLFFPIMFAYYKDLIKTPKAFFLNPQNQGILNPQKWQERQE
jgi:hypothetical protein